MCSIVKNQETMTDTCWCWYYQCLFMSTILCWFYFLKMQQSDTEDFLHSTPTGQPNPEDDCGNHDPGGANKWLERFGQQIDSRQHWEKKQRKKLASPLHDVFVRKVKMLKKFKSELGKLMQFHSDSWWFWNGHRTNRS